MNMIMRVARATMRAVRVAGSFGVNVLIPALGIPRPYNYLAGIFWVYWIGCIGYLIISK
jgi:hypothetical protein